MSETMLNQHRQASPLISTDQFISFFSPDHSNPNSNLVQLMSNSSSMAAFLPAASNHNHHHDLLIPNLADHHHHHPALFTTLLQQPTTLADEDDEEDEDEDDDDDEDDCDYDYISDRNLNCLNGQSFNLPRRSSTNPILGKEFSNYMSSSSDHLIMVPATETQEYQWELRSGVKRQYHLEEWKKTNDDVRYDCNDREDVENPNNTVLDKRDNKNTTQKKKTKKNGSADIRRGVQMKSYKTTKASGRRKVREPRFCFKTLSDVDVLDDGYKWRKYGQKVVKNTQHPRSYYRCTQDNCRVKKRVERLAEDPRMVITTYEGRHVHSPSHDNDDEDNPNNIGSSTIPFLSNFFG